jgi:hypothetical protein
MKKLFSALIITCLGTILIGLNTKEHNPPLPEAVKPETSHVEAVHEPIALVSVPEPIPTVETIVEPPSEPTEQVPVVEQTINQAQAGVTYSPNDCEQYRPILSKYNWDVNVAMAIMKAESGCRYEAFNPEWHRGCQGSLGLFQIACLHQGSSFDPETNIATAYRIYSGSGWRPWGAYTNGSYTRYL